MAYDRGVLCRADGLVTCISALAICTLLSGKPKLMLFYMATIDCMHLGKKRKGV